VEKEYILSLLAALYRVTAVFPENEPLRFKIREIANDILADFVCSKKDNLDKDLEILFSYFSIAKQQNWVNPKNFLVLEQKYKEIADFKLKKEKKPVKPVENSKNTGNSSNSRTKRQKNIMKLMENTGKITLEELKQEFSDVSPRTLRRDVSDLVDKDYIKRIRKSKKDVIFILPGSGQI